MDPGVLLAPGAGSLIEQLRQRLGAKALSGLGHRTLADRLFRGDRQGQIQRRQDFGHGLPPVNRQPDDQPYHLLGRQPPTPNARRTRRRERLFNPCVRQMLSQPVKAGYRQNIRCRVKLARQHRAES